MELGINPFFDQDDRSGNSTFDGRNGVDEDGNLWVDGKKAKVLNRKPRQTKAGKATFGKGTGKVGKLRAILDIVGSFIDADHQGPVKNPVEDAVDRKLKNTTEDKS